MTTADLALIIAMPLLSVSILLAFVRLLRGPSLPDRVIALDLMATLGIGVTAIYAVGTGQPAFLDVGVVLALLAFLGTVAFAYYLERRVQS